MDRTLTILLFITLFLISACKEAKPGPETSRPPISKTTEPKDDILQKVDDEGRIVWQKPEEVVKMLGDISEKTIADIGAGSGYFTFRFAMKAAKVIAIDIDPKMIQIVETFKQQLPQEIQNKIETRLALPNDPKIQNEEADIIVIINTIGYIENRKSYLRTLHKGLAENGEIFILDFKTKNIPINAPAMEYRVPLGTLENELNSTGFEIILSDDRTLDYQYILKALKK